MRRFFMTLVVAGTFAGCGLFGGGDDRACGPVATPGTRSEGSVAEAQLPAGSEECAPVVQQSELELRERDEGVAILFNANGGDVAELRREVRNIADALDDEVQGGGEVHEMRGLPYSLANVEETPNGAMLVLEPETAETGLAAEDPQYQQKVEQFAVHIARQIQQGICPG